MKNIHDTEPTFYAEGLNDIFLRDRPSLKNVYRQMFGELEGSEIICVKGRTNSGKSMLLMELMARTVMQEEGERKPEVLFVDIDKQFSIFKFADICMKFCLKEETQQDRDHITRLPNHIKSQLEKLHVVSNCNIHNMNINNISPLLNTCLKENKNISLVVIDSLGSYYYSDLSTSLRTKEGPLKKDYYLLSYMKKFKILAEKYQVSFVYSKPSFMEFAGAYKDQITTHVVSLFQKNTNMYEMQVKTGESSTEMLYTIDSFGMEIISENVESTQNRTQVEDEDTEYEIER